jgi:glycine oxidase
LNRKCFVLPIGNNLLKVGATYEWHNSTLHITPEGLHELKEKLACLVKGDFDVVKQEAGIRPTVSDRRPLLGKSAEFPQLFLYNGLGTKGYLMAPLLSKEMAELILEGKEPPMEYNTKRFSFN